MDLTRIIWELRSELEDIEWAILSLERLNRPDTWNNETNIRVRDRNQN